MHDVIDTKSKFFKLYADRRIRVGESWDVEEVLKEPVDICKYGRNVALEIGRHALIKLAILLGGLLATFMILTPIISGLLWLFTDNPFIIFFGEFGKAIMMIDALVIMVVGVLVVTWAFVESSDYLKRRAKDALYEVESIGSVGQTVSWIKAMHGKFCVPLKFDREPKSNEDNE